MFESPPSQDDRQDPLLVALHDAEQRAGTAFLAQLDALAALWSDTPDGRSCSARDHVLAEAALALGLHPLTVGTRLAHALELQELPQLRRLVAAGRLGVAHTLAVLDQTSELDPAVAGRVVDEVLLSGGRTGWSDTPAKLRRALEAAARRLDPEGCRERAEAKLRDRTGTRLRDRGDGLAAWEATGAAEQLAAVDRLVDALARHGLAGARPAPADGAASSGPGEQDGGEQDGSDPAGVDDRTLGQRRIDALLGALVAAAGDAVDLELQLRLPVTSSASVLVPQAGGPPLAEPLVISTDLTPELLAALQGELAARRTRPAATDDAAADSGPQDAGLSGTGTAGDGPLAPVIALDRPQTREPSEDGTRPVGGGGTGRHSSSAGSTADAAGSAVGHGPPGRRRPEHLDTPPRPPEDAGPAPDQPLRPRPPRPEPRLHWRRSAVDPDTTLVGLGVLPPDRLVDLLDHRNGLPAGLRRVRVRRVLVDRFGQAVAVDPGTRTLADLLAGPPVGQHGDDPASGGRLLTRLLSGLPAPPPAVDRYRPSAAQARVVQARDVTCCFPGCSRRARRSQLDHRRRYPDGPTSVANLHALCAHHHRLKHDGWACARLPDGTTAWRSPRGQTALARRRGAGVLLDVPAA